MLKLAVLVPLNRLTLRITLLFREFSSEENSLELLRLGDTRFGTKFYHVGKIAEGQEHQFNKWVWVQKEKTWICSHEKDDVECAPFESSQGNACTYLVELFWIWSSKTAKTFAVRILKSSDYSIWHLKGIGVHWQKNETDWLRKELQIWVFVFSSLRLKERIFDPNSKEEFCRMG